MTRTPSLRRLIVPFVVGALALSTIVPTAIAKDPNPNQKPKDPVSVQILGLNDYHGQLEAVSPVSSSAGRIGFLTDTDNNPATPGECLPATCVAAGGTEYLATHVAALKATNPNASTSGERRLRYRAVPVRRGNTAAVSGGGGRLGRLPGWPIRMSSPDSTA